MKKLLKKIIPNKIIQILRIGLKNKYYYSKLRKIAKNNNDKRIYIFGTAIHKNLGDHLITLSELEFFKENKPKFEVIEIPTEVYEVYKKTLLKIINQKNLIIINGGGWMGNLWRKEELIIEDMVSSFKNNKIIIFPQTIFFDKNTDSYEELLSSSKKVFSSHSNLTITVRDRKSYDFAIENYKKNKILLVPDIALYYYKYSNQFRNLNKKKIVKICLRKDRENISYDFSKLSIFNILNKYGYKSEKIDTISRKRVSELKRRNTLYAKLKDFAESSLIVTDRLHGMIFSYLVGTPCIIIDNKTKKVSGVYNEWLKESNYILPIYNKDINEIESFILNNSNNKLKENSIDFNFKDLIEEVKYGEN